MQNLIHDPVWMAVLAAALGYLSGSISFARIITRIAAPGVDLSKLQFQLQGSSQSAEVGIVGANAASMVVGPRLGLIIAALDMLKVILPMFLFQQLSPGRVDDLVASVGALAGHNWPVYYRFMGGRGFAVISGSFLYLDWLGAIACTVIGLAFGMTILGNPMIAYLSWLWLMIPWMFWRMGVPGLVYALVVNLLFVAAVLPDIRMMLRMRREGIFEAYMEGMYASSPRWRGMKKMTDRLWLLRLFFKRKPDSN